MARCSFCGETLPEGRGKMHVKKTGQSFYFCHSKCQRNFSLGRQGVKTRWTTTFRKKKVKK